MTEKIITYHLPDWEAEVKSFISENEQIIHLRAERRALDNMPSPACTNIDTEWHECHLSYQHLLDENSKRIPHEGILRDMREREEKASSMLQLLNNQLIGAKEQLIDKTKALAIIERPKFDRRKMAFARVFAILIFVADAALTAPSFEKAGYSYLECLCIASVVALILFLASHYFESTVRKGKTPRQRKLIVFGFITAIILLTITIAAVRSIAASGYSDVTQQNTATVFMPLLFVMVSLGAFAASVAIRHYLLPNPEHKKALVIYEVKLKEIETCEQLKARLEAELAQVAEENREQQRVWRSILMSARHIENLIIRKADSGLQQFKRINMATRPDKATPKCFLSTKYPIPFIQYFIDLPQ